MTASELSVMPPGDCVLFVRGHNPFYGRKYDTFRHPKYKFTGDFDGA
jgi:type IV secretory pathway TraG/TraD family ATPase VirD4